jgi:benzoylformate decarboxylase
MATVREATFHLLRRLGMTTVFGNPGSTELPFLKDFPEDFRYVLGLQEATVLGMAEGFAQGTGRAALVNLHTGPGLGNAMGAMITAWHDKTPLVVTAGQQDRRHRSLEPLLTGKLVDLAKPYVKGSFEPVRAEETCQGRSGAPTTPRCNSLRALSSSRSRWTTGTQKQTRWKTTT